MSDRFLLYIDILGFSEMVSKEPRKVVRVYEILDTLNVHGRSDFKVIVFSDTILIYSSSTVSSDPDRAYCIQALIDFASDLHHRLVGQDIYFRAVIVKGDFHHYERNHVNCFFGSALITAYHAEKAIPSLGLFISDECSRFGLMQKIADFSPGLSFVFLCEGLQALSALSPNKWPINLRGSPGEDFAINLPWDVRFLKDIHTQMRKHADPAVRTKFLTAWDFYQRRYKGALNALVQSDFSIAGLVSSDWDMVTKKMDEKIKYFKRIGAGTDLSRNVQESSRQLGESFKLKYKKGYLG
ncbi:hypothetical protein LT706_17465 [Pseudomonas syringae pv. syringae]|uniref:hypothetical protein n=1 Tax=Pseudomonas TaxID=286 RepID=UPI0006B93473|nr:MULTISPECIES: hypothetical protein [Pseudomonas]MCK9713303.1 hypothetical protein [Pseudomonas syringae pv. syringae]MDA7013688.1 hypothetical protein [Pseudomonas cerasi]PBP49693.1 hypothetical protein CCL13_02370 [Pseudomonas syringae]